MKIEDLLTPELEAHFANYSFMDEVLNPSGWMRYDIVTDHPAFNKWVDLATEAVVQRRREHVRPDGTMLLGKAESAKTLRKLRESVSIICANLCVNMLTGHDVKLRTNLNRNIVASFGVSADMFIDAVTHLEDIAWQLVEFGKHPDAYQAKDKGYVTRIEESPFFSQAVKELGISIRDFYPSKLSKISIRNEKKEDHWLPIGLNEPQQVYYDSCKQNLETINRLMSDNWVDLCISDSHLYNLQKEVGARYNRDSEQRKRNPNGDHSKQSFIDFYARHYHRVFNNGTIEQGGRFYGVWWQSVPKEYRKFITINGEPTVEIDFKSIHPSMLFAAKGIKLDRDPYAVDLSKYGLDKDDWEANKSEWRKFCKRALNIAINATGKSRVPLDYEDSRYSKLLTWEKLKNAVIDANPEIREHMNSGEGIKLQALDSKIAEKVMMSFAQDRIACLCIHDSFIVEAKYQDRLKDIMIRSYVEVVGMEPTGLDINVNNHIDVKDTDKDMYRKYIARKSYVPNRQVV